MVTSRKHWAAGYAGLLLNKPDMDLDPSGQWRTERELRATFISNIPLSLEFQSAWIVKPRRSCSSEMS